MRLIWHLNIYFSITESHNNYFELIYIFMYPVSFKLYFQSVSIF